MTKFLMLLIFESSCRCFDIVDDFFRRFLSLLIARNSYLHQLFLLINNIENIYLNNNINFTKKIIIIFTEFQILEQDKNIFYIAIASKFIVKINNIYFLC